MTVNLPGGNGALFSVLWDGYNHGQGTRMAWPLSPETPVGRKNEWHRITRRIFRLAVCIAAVIAVSGLLYAVPLRDRPLSAVLSFLFVSLTVAALWGFPYTVFVSFIAAIAFSWLIPPVGYLQIRDLRDLYALLAFLILGITTSHFSDRARREALNANQRHAEAVAAQQRFSDLVNSVEGIVWEADAQTFAFLFVSDQAERILGYPAEQWLKEPSFWKDHLHPEDRNWAVQFCVQATSEKRNHDFEYRMIAANGSVVWLRDLVTVVVENGRASRLRGMMIDVTQPRRAELARQELEEQWKAAFESNPTMYFIVDAAGAIVLVNTFGAEQLGYRVSELVGQPVLDVFYESDRDAIRNRTKECFENPGRMMRWEARKIRKDGTMLWVRETANAVVLQKRPVLLIVCENITEQKRAEEAARRSEKEIRDLIETIPVMVFSIRPDGSTEFVSRNWQDYAGLSLEKTSRIGWQATVHPEDVDTHLHKWRASMATGETFENEVRHRSAKGEYRWFLVRAVPLRDEHGNILKWYGILTDIEDRKRAEALLTGEKRILEMVAKGDSLNQILHTLCRLVEEQASDVLTSILLLEGNRLRHGGAPSLPKAYTDAIDGIVIGPSVGSCGTAAYRGEQVIVEDIATDPLWADYRGAALPHSLRACWSTPIFSGDGKVIATFAMYYRQPRRPSLRDQQIIEQITHLAGVAIERKLIQDALRRSEAYLAEAQRLTHTGSWAFSPVTKKTLYWSDELFRLWGFDPQPGPPDLQTVLPRVHPEDRERIGELFERGFDGHLTMDVALDHRIVLSDGSVRYHQGISHPVFDQSGHVVEYVGTAIDVTERKRGEEALRRSEAYLAESQRFTKTGSWAYEPFSGKTVYWSEEMFRIFGLDPQQGLPSTETLWQRIHPQDRDIVYEQMLKAGREKTEYVNDHRIVLPDGTVKHIHALGHPLIAAGEVVEFVGTSIDVTERRRAEEERDKLRKLEADLAHINRVSMMGELTASLAHEIKQPIAAAVSNAEACLQWLAHDQPDLNEVREAAAETVKEARRAGEIMTRIRSLFKKGEITRAVLDINQVIAETVSLVREEADRSSIAVRMELDAGLPRIVADRVQLQQVLMNLMLNGIESMNGSRGELTIKSERDEEGRPLISVSDAGMGLPLEERDKIFDAFFTTKPQGTGMGLAISRSIIESHGGRLWAKSNVRQGATFYFTLPNEVAEAA